MKDIKAHFYKKLYVGPSEISGNGLFAGEYIKANEYILSFGGILALVSDRNTVKYLSSTFAGIADGIMICEDSTSQKDYSDYINHSCNPNIGMDDCLTIVALKDIEKDEELVCDYAFWEADENWKMKCECNCGSINCRKAITGKDWRNVKSSDKYFPFYSPFLQRRIIKNEGSS